MRITKHCLAVLILLLLGGSIRAMAQITIAPTTIYLDDRNRFGTMLVLNGSDQPQEVSIEFEYGYLAADSVGNTLMVYDDSVTAAQKSIADRILGFPQNFTLQPNQRQVVRLTVRNTGNLADGTYWTRIRTISNPVSPSIDQQTTEGITAEINFRFQQVTTAFFKKGDVTTGVEVVSPRVEISDNAGRIYTDINQTGNSPYIGQMTLRIRDAEGEIRSESRTSVALYFQTRRIFTFSAEDMPPGSYTAEMLFETTRSSIEDDQMVQADPITIQFDFRVE